MTVAIDAWRTPKRRLIDHMMIEATGHDLAHYVRTNHGPSMGYRRLAQAVTDLTGVDVGPTSIRKWVGRD